MAGGDSIKEIAEEAIRNINRLVSLTGQSSTSQQRQQSTTTESRLSELRNRFPTTASSISSTSSSSSFQSSSSGQSRRPVPYRRTPKNGRGPGRPNKSDFTIKDVVIVRFGTEKTPTKRQSAVS